jgi:hypothetical protein
VKKRGSTGSESGSSGDENNRDVTRHLRLLVRVGGLDEVLQQLAARALQAQRDDDGAVQEVCDL